LRVRGEHHRSRCTQKRRHEIPRVSLSRLLSDRHGAHANAWLRRCPSPTRYRPFRAPPPSPLQSPSRAAPKRRAV
jgi:hypothetical protein